MRVSEINICLLAIVGSSVCRITFPETLKLTRHSISFRVTQGIGLCFPSLVNRNLTSTPRFRFTGGTNVTLEGSRDPHWGWVNSYGQQVGEKTQIISGRALTEFYQWWDAMQEIALQVNRPHGWGFQNIVNGEIKYMKLWQVSADENYLCRRGSEIYPSSARSVVFQYQWLRESTRSP